MTAADELVAFLRTRGGEAPAAACSEHLRARGYGSAARKSAKERARVVSRKSGYGGRWLWRLADDVEGAAVVPVAAAPAPSPVITISPGPRNARTDPATGLRSYTWQGRDLPSVTSIRRIAGLPHGLHQWAINQVISHALDHWPELTERLAGGDPGQLKAVRQELRSAATAQRDKAADLGTAVHDAAARRLSPLEVPPEVAPRLRQYLDWLSVSGAEILATERQVWNLALGYAGSFDLLVRLRDGSIHLVDLKTGKGTYPEYALQLFAYAMAEFVGEDDVVDERVTELLHAVKGMAVLHLTDTGWEYIALRPDPATWSAFRGLLAFAVWMATHQDMASVTLALRAGREGPAA